MHIYQATIGIADIKSPNAQDSNFQALGLCLSGCIWLQFSSALFKIRSAYPCKSALTSLDHAKVIECLLDCFFLIGWALGLSCILGLWFVVIFSLNDTAFLLHLSDIQAADLESGMFQHIFLDFPHKWLYSPQQSNPARPS